MQEDRLTLIEKLARQLYSSSSLFDNDRAESGLASLSLHSLLNHAGELAAMAHHSLVQPATMPAAAKPAAPLPEPDPDRDRRAALQALMPRSSAEVQRTQDRSASPQLKDPALISALMKLKRQRDIYAAQATRRSSGTSSGVQMSTILRPEKTDIK